jgi:hypothetical protein
MEIREPKRAKPVREGIDAESTKRIGEVISFAVVTDPSQLKSREALTFPPIFADPPTVRKFPVTRCEQLKSPENTDEPSTLNAELLVSGEGARMFGPVLERPPCMLRLETSSDMNPTDSPPAIPTSCDTEKSCPT